MFPSSCTEEKIRIVLRILSVATKIWLDHYRRITYTERKVNDISELPLKDAQLLALLDSLLDGLFEVWDAPKNLPPRERLLLLLSRDLRDTYYDEQSVAKLELFFAYWTMGLHHQEIKERILQAIERTRQVSFPAICDLLESKPTRFPGVTPDGLVTVIIGIAEGCALQALLIGHQIPLEQILAALRALLGAN
jgi:hypothetical protein